MVLSDACKATLQESLFRFRKSAGLTQAQVAEYLNLCRCSYVQMENGNRAVTALELYALSILYNRPMERFFE